jgi:hypothetical protein
VNPFYLRQINCYQQPERSLVEVFRVLVFGILVNPCPKAVYEALWATATYAADERREWFEGVFELTNLQIDGFDFVVTLNPTWFVAYNEAVEAGEAPIDAPCPCDSF